MNEKWEDISGFEGLYRVSNFGDIESIERKDRFGRRVARRNLTHSISRGYKTVKLSKDGKAICRSIHQLVATTYLDNPNNLRQVNHINGIKTDNRLINLEWVSEKENVRHAIASGLADNMRKGAGHARTKYRITARNVKTSHEFLMVGTADIQRNGFNPRHVYECLSGRLKHHKGHTFHAAPNDSEYNQLKLKQVA